MKKGFIVEKDILFYALRYALGRRTFAPVTVMDNVRKNINLFTREDIKLMIKEIKEQDYYGADSDVLDWMSFIKYLEKRLKRID